MKLGRIEKRAMTSKGHSEHGVEHVERLLAYIDLAEGLKYLEVGCGNGHVCKHLALRHHLNVTGTDVDPEMISLAREGLDDAQSIRFMEMDATSMPFNDGTFHIVLSFGVMHHIPDWEHAMEEVCRVLKPEGFFIFGDIAYSGLSTRILRPIVRRYGVYSIDEVIHFMETKGLEPIHREQPIGSLLKYHSIIFKKDGQESSPPSHVA